MTTFEAYQFDDLQIIQKYILPANRTVRKYRAYWRAQQAPAISLITNKFKLPFNSQRSTRSQNTVYMHKLSTYPFAGRMLKSSFSPSLPNKPGLKPVTSRNIHKVRSNLTESMTGFDTRKYVVKSDANPSVVTILTPFKNIEAMCKELVEIVNESQRRLGMPLSSSATIDFIKDETGQWYLIGCKFESLVLKDLISHANSSKRNSNKKETNLNFHRPVVKPDISELLLKQRFENLRARVAKLKGQQVVLSNSVIVSRQHESFMKFFSYAPLPTIMP